MIVNWLIRRAKRTPYTHLFHADGALYMERFWLFQTRWISARLHQIATPDYDRHMHDHPWSFVSMILRGGYVEHRPVDLTSSPHDWNGAFRGSGMEPCTAKLFMSGDVVFRRATDRHLISSVDPGTWTLFITGPKRHGWGFYTPQGKIYWRDYPVAIANDGKLWSGVPQAQPERISE